MDVLGERKFLGILGMGILGMGMMGKGTRR
jgi:hypothetical protein